MQILPLRADLLRVIFIYTGNNQVEVIDINDHYK